MQWILQQMTRSVGIILSANFQHHGYMRIVWLRSRNAVMISPSHDGTNKNSAEQNDRFPALDPAFAWRCGCLRKASVSFSAGGEEGIFSSARILVTKAAGSSSVCVCKTSNLVETLNVTGACETPNSKPSQQKGRISQACESPIHPNSHP